MKIDKKIRFPLGIFILLFLLFCLFSLAILTFIFYNNSKRQISEIERNTRVYTVSLIEASGQIAENYNKKFNPEKLNQFFKDGKSNGLYYKAFFVLKNARIIAHSDLSEKKELINSIASEEMQYNLTQIFLPLENKGITTYFLEYNIVDKKIPFNRQELKYIKQYLYENIDRNGWLITRAVTTNEKKIGTINFIISKEKIYNTIKTNIEHILQNLIILGIVSFTLSLFISLISMIRFQSFKIKVLSKDKQGAKPVIQPKFEKKSENIISEGDIIITNNSSAKGKEIHSLDDNPTEVNIIYEDTDESIMPEKLNIQNAIPVHRRKFK